MDIPDANGLAQKFDKRTIYDDDKVDEFICQHSQSINDKLLVLTSIVKLFDSLPSFSMNHLILRYRAKSQLYVNLIDQLVEKKSNSVYQLKELWKSDSDVAKYVYEALNQNNDEKFAYAMGYILAGLAKKDPEKLFRTINNNMVQPSVIERIAYTIALQGIERNQIIPSQFVDFIIFNADSGNRKLKETAIYVLIERFNSFGIARSKLEELCKSKDDNILYFISGNLLVISRENKKLVFRLLSICAKSTKNTNVLWQVSSTLGAVAKDYPIGCLRVVKSWIINNPSWKRFTSLYLLNEIGESNPQEIVKFIYEWASKEKDDSILIYDISELLVGIFENHHEPVLDFLAKLDHRLRKNMILTVTILERLLAGQYEKVDRSSRFASGSFGILSKITSRRGLNISRIIKGEDDVVMQSLMLIDAIKEYERGEKIDLRKALVSLKQFPNVASFFKGVTWFTESIKNKKDPHPLVLFLERSSLSERKKTNNYYPYLLMCDIEECLGEFGHKESGIKHLRDGMRNPDQFFQTLSELQIASGLKKRFPIDFEPKVKTKELDIGVSIDNQYVYIEVITPTMYSKLKYIGLVADVPNRARQKLIDKIIAQLREASLHTDSPIVVVIDVTDAPDISSLDVINAIYGSTQLTLVSEKASGKIVGTFPSRKDDSISDEPNEGRIISAVTIFRRQRSLTNEKIELVGDLYVNPKARNPLDESIRRTLADTILQ